MRIVRNHCKDKIIVYHCRPFFEILSVCAVYSANSVHYYVNSGTVCHCQFWERLERLYVIEILIIITIIFYRQRGSEEDKAKLTKAKMGGTTEW